MGKGVFAALAGLVAAGITVALLAAASPPSRSCAPSHPKRGVKIDTLIPPGNSSVSEYVENVPTARGGCPSVGLGAATGARLLRPSTKRALRAQGPDGAATVTLVRATNGASGIPGLPAAGGNSAPRRRNSSATASGATTSPLGALADAIGGSSGGQGLGALFPIVLIVCLLGAGMLVFVRQRRRRS